MGISDGAVQVTTNFMDSLKREPLSLALVVMNLALLVVFFYILMSVAAQREREIKLLYDDKKDVRDLLLKCVDVPVRERRSDAWRSIPLPLER